MNIYFLNGPRAGEEMKLNPPSVTLGRETDNDINLLVGGVSRYHAKIEFNKGEWIVKDAGSTNGTKVNKTLITEPFKLAMGDIISLGDQDIRFGEVQKNEKPTALAPQESASEKPATQEPPAQEPPAQEAPAQEPPTEESVFSPMPDPIIKSPEPIIKSPEPVSPPSPDQSPMISSTSQTIADASNTDAGGAPKSFFDELKFGQPETGDALKNDGNLFNKMNFFGTKNPDEEQGGEDKSAKKGIKKRSNILFYVIVIGMAVIFVSIFIMTQKTNSKRISNTGGAKAAKKASASLILSYRKQITSPDNIFCFSLSIENGSAAFSLDDLKTQRHYSRKVANVDEAHLEPLVETIKNSNFMSLQSEAPGMPQNGIDDVRSMIIANENNLNEITIKNSFAPSSFEQIEAAVDEFAEHYGLRTISLTPKEMKNEAEKAFHKAEQLFQNYAANPANIREAIVRYKITVEMLAQFVPKPKMWDIARKKLQEAQAIQDSIRKELYFDFERSKRLNELSNARDICVKLMQLEAPDSKRYNKAREYKVALDKILMKRKKK